MEPLARRTLVLVLAFVVAGCGAGATFAPSASSVPSGSLGAPSGSPTAGPSATATASGDPVTDEDDGATTGNTVALPNPAPSVDPTATAVGRLPGEPDPALTPGALNPVVTQATISSTICVSGWTATIRPPSSYTTSLKVQQIALYGYADTRTASYEEDHLISLQLGGAPDDPKNLWPEPYVATLPDGRDVGARVKDSFENSLKRAVCDGSMTLAAAQAKIGINWVHAFYGIPLASSGATAAPTGASVPTGSSPPPGLPAPARSSPAGALTVTFVSLPDPAIPLSTVSMTAATSPGAVCSAKVTWPSGTVSAATGLKATPKANSAGLASWTWSVGSTTKPGTAKAAVTCTLGATATATATFTVR